MGFWIIAAAAALITVAILGRALIGSGRTEEEDAISDVQVYRDQLRELDRDVARGVIGEAEAERARVETSRRLLEADRRAQAEAGPNAAPRGLTYGALGAAALVLVGGGLGLYSVAGAPGTHDLPLKTRIADATEAMANRASQEALEADLPHWAGPPPEAPADYVEMVDKLRDTVADRPDDLQGHVLLAQSEAALGNYSAAHKAMAKVIALRGDEVAADDFTKHADLLVLAASGTVSPEAEASVRAALKRDPEDGIALYYLGLMYGQNDRPDLGFPIWRKLLERSQPSDPWAAPIRGNIEQLAALAGVDYTPTPAAPAPMGGPSEADIAAAQDMSPAEQAEMVRNMVDGLMARLASEGGTPPEWARLIRALSVLGETDQARAIWGEAQAVFAAEPEGLKIIDETARAAGLLAPIGFDETGPVAGPTADDIAAASEMAPDDQAAMIEGMVQRLSDRIASEGGSPAEWAQLIGALGVLGDRERAREVWIEARGVFAGDAAGRAVVDDAAAQARLGPLLAADGTSGAGGAAPGPAHGAQAIAQLMERLATEGGTPDDWMDLVTALAAQGASEDARTIWGEAREVFSAHPEAVTAIDAAAREAGLSDPVPFVRPSADAPAKRDAVATESASEDELMKIDGRITGLFDSLATSGGPPEDWVELLDLLGQVGEAERGRVVWSEAQKAFAGDPTGLAQIRAAAEALGVVE